MLFDLDFQAAEILNAVGKTTRPRPPIQHCQAFDPPIFPLFAGNRSPGQGGERLFDLRRSRSDFHHCPEACLCLPQRFTAHTGQNGRQQVTPRLCIAEQFADRKQRQRPRTEVLKGRCPPVTILAWQTSPGVDQVTWD